MITPLIALALRLALRLPKSWGFYPVGFYVGQSLAALRIDDLDAALEFFLRAQARDFGHEKVRVLREILGSEIDYRLRLLRERTGPDAGDAERQEAQRGIAVLRGFLGRLNLRENQDQNSTRPTGL